MCNKPPRTWPYWKNKKGLERALSYYFDDYHDHPTIAQAILQLKHAESVIDAYFKELADKDDQS